MLPRSLLDEVHNIIHNCVGYLCKADLTDTRDLHASKSLSPFLMFLSLVGSRFYVGFYRNYAKKSSFSS